MNGDPDNLEWWIGTLRGRLERGELAALPQIDLGYGSRADADLVAGIMLGELDAYIGLPHEAAEQPDNVVRRRSLLWDLLWLRQQIG